LTDRFVHLHDYRTLRTDSWRTAPLLVAVALIAFIAYAAWATLQNADYYSAPYLSPFYSPCISANCDHVTVPLIGSWWNLSPAFLILWIPAGLRVTCYYYRKAYYRAFLRLPPACAVRDAPKSYTGESAFPFVLQNAHRYFLYLSMLVLVFIWWDAILAFKFPDGFGIGMGTLVLLINAVLLSLYSLSCHSCRHICGGNLKSFHGHPVRFNAWRAISQLNKKHKEYGWASLISVGVADLYVRLLAMGIVRDLRLW
jgi:hypothetical protein